MPHGRGSRAAPFGCCHAAHSLSAAVPAPDRQTISVFPAPSASGTSSAAERHAWQATGKLAGEPGGMKLGKHVTTSAALARTRGLEARRVAPRGEIPNTSWRFTYAQRPQKTRITATEGTDGGPWSMRGELWQPPDAQGRAIAWVYFLSPDIPISTADLDRGFELTLGRTCVATCRVSVNGAVSRREDPRE